MLPEPGSQMDQEISLIKETMAQLDKQSHFRMDERRFCLVFLPFFAGTSNPYNVSMQTWSEITGGTNLPVDIIDTRGQVLFSVNSVYDYGAINPIANPDDSDLTHVVKTVKQYEAISVAQATNYMDREFAKRNISTASGAKFIEHIREWNAIFDRYGYPKVLPELFGNETKLLTQAPQPVETFDEWEPL